MGDASGTDPDPYGRGRQWLVTPRCHRCNRMLALVITPPSAIRCPRCKAMNMWGDVELPRVGPKTG